MGRGMKDDNNPYRTMPAPPATARGIEAARLVGQPMTVDFALTGDDYAAFNLHWQDTSEFMRRSRRKVWILLAVMTLVPATISVATMENDPGLATFLGLIAIVTLVWTAAIIALRRRNVSRSIHNIFRNMTGRAMVGPRTLTIRPDAIHTVSEVSETTYKWIGIERIETNAVYVFFYQGSNGAIIVPKWAFSSEEQLQLFLETARQFHRQATEADAKKA